MGGQLTPMFFPAGVAVIGASRDPDKIGHAVLANILKGSYKGKVLPVNPKAPRIMGRRCFPSIKAAAVAAPVDLAVIAIPAPFVPEVIDECGAAGVRAAVVISAGFRESGREGMFLERRLIEAARRHKISLLGPNCLGLVTSEAGLNATFARLMPLAGGVALMSQSGALCTSVLDWSLKAQVGFSRFVSLGNKAGVNEVDLLRDWRRDERVKVVAVYLEQVADGPGFLKEAAMTARKKPLIILKAGVTGAGARAASSHTGSLAGSEMAYRAAVQKTNALKASTMEDFFDLISLASQERLPRRGGVAVVTNAGGPGILTADACELEGLRMASFSSRTVSRLAKALPGDSSLYNPVDVLGDAPADRYRGALEAVAADSDTASVIVILTPQAITEIRETAGAIIELAAATPKPVVACFLGEEDVGPGVELLSRNGVPNFRFPERAVAALDKLHNYAENRRRPKAKKEPRLRASRARVKTAIGFSRGGGYLHIGGLQALDILGAYGLKAPPGALARTPDEAAAIAASIGFPVAMKVISPNILHKSDVGGIKVGVADEQGARQAFEEIRMAVKVNMADALFVGVAVQEQIEDAREVIIGASRDPQFGPMLMFGLGGIYVEVLKDVSFRIAPLTRDDAFKMMTEVRAFPLLSGSRGQKPADTGAIVEALLRCSQLVVDFPDILEMDINPLLVKPRGRGAVAADARLVITP